MTDHLIYTFDRRPGTRNNRCAHKELNAWLVNDRALLRCGDCGHEWDERLRTG